MPAKLNNSKLANSSPSPIQTDLNLEVYIRSRTEDYFKGQAKSVTAYNETGPFDILPLHANLITLIQGTVTINRGLESEKKVELKKNGVLSVFQTKVDIYVGV